MKHVLRAVAPVFAVVLLWSGQAFAAGFYLPGRGVRPMGRAGAYVASGEGNLNSLWYNPANLTLSDGLELTVDLAVVDLAFDFQRAPRTPRGGEKTTYGQVSSNAPPQPIPQMLIGGPTSVDGLSWAVGFYTPYMSGVRFPEKGPERYALVDNVGSVMGFLHAAVSYEIGDWFRIGGGLQNGFASFRLVSTTSGYTGLHGRPEDKDLDILSKISLRDYFAPAANVGMWLELAPALQVAVSGQTPVNFSDGDAELTVRMPSHPEFDNAHLSNNTLSAGLSMPAVVRAAVRVVADPVDLEVAGVWEGWSTFDEIQATPNNIEVEGVPGVGSIPVGPLSLPEHWRDTFSMRLGGACQINDAVAVRAGYAYETGAVPDQYYSVFSPDSDKHVLAGGLSWAIDRWELDVGTAYYLFSDRDIDDSNVRQINPADADDELATVVGNGQYSSRYVVFGLGANYAFE